MTADAKFYTKLDIIKEDLWCALKALAGTPIIPAISSPPLYSSEKDAISFGTQYTNNGIDYRSPLLTSLQGFNLGIVLIVTAPMTMALITGEQGN